MNQLEFHQLYEEESERIYNTLIKLDEDELLKIIEDPLATDYKKWVGNDNYQLWQVFKATGTNTSIKPIFEIASSLTNKYLIRYHACSALFVIVHIKDDELKGEVQYGLNANKERVDQKAAIDRLKEMLKGLED